MKSTIYDYAIIGAGAAGLQLALSLSQDPFFDNHNIILIDKSAKSTNDKTWCFWEKGEGKWDSIITKKWDQCGFITTDKNSIIPLKGYSYKMLQSIDFYNYALTEVKKNPNIEIITSNVDRIASQENVTIHTNEGTFEAKHIFDSRISQDFQNVNDKYTRILQHFRGWMIESETDVFDDEQFTMMDFSVKWPESTSFMYVLPISKKKALVEYTFFSHTIANDEDYDKMIRHYIEDILQIEQYDVQDIEKGVIPMSDYPFHKHHTKQITKIGTAGGWVRASSGYSFKNAEKACNQIIKNLKTDRLPSTGILKKRFAFYDSIFLKVLDDHNYLGESIFASMYFKNGMDKILKFLDQETSMKEEVGIINNFQKGPFINGLFKILFR